MGLTIGIELWNIDVIRVHIYKIGIDIRVLGFGIIIEGGGK